MNHKSELRLLGEISTTSDNADDTTLMAESEEELKSLLMRVKEKSAKVGLKLNIKKTKIMACSPLTSWQIDGEEMEVVTDFILLGSKVIADRDCSQDIKRRLLLGRKAMANLDSTLKSRDITLPTKKGYITLPAWTCVEKFGESKQVNYNFRRSSVNNISPISATLSSGTTSVLSYTSRPYSYPSYPLSPSIPLANSNHVGQRLYIPNQASFF
ncbi:putative RNA-binding protein 46 [Varanus komodoensis]|nr:putative RNA-binding protein 46 [Varanus komodoensis]